MVEYMARMGNIEPNYDIYIAICAELDLAPLFPSLRILNPKPNTEMLET